MDPPTLRRFRIMRVFITGSTGYVGSAIVKAFLAAKHQVTGLARSPDKEAGLKAVGASPLRGDIKDPSTYQAAATEHDAIIHVAAEMGPQQVQADMTALQTLASAARAQRGKRCFIYTSGVWVLGDTAGKTAFEDASTSKPAALAAWRPSHEKILTEATTGDVAMMVIRPGVVYGGKAGIVSGFFQSAVSDGAASYIGTGENHWPLVHRDDLAQLYVIAAEKRAWGVFHGVDGQPMKVSEIARAASQAAGKGGKVKSVPLEEAKKKLGAYAETICMDQQIGTRRSTDLGWKPSRRSFADAAAEAFREWSA
jgi:nucleoside-diphosphate-sugar epimerase